MFTRAILVYSPRYSEDAHIYMYIYNIENERIKRRENSVDIHDERDRINMATLTRDDTIFRADMLLPHVDRTLSTASNC